MRVRFGLVVGFAIGYILGAKAGRERYEQLTRLYRQISSSQPAQQMGSEVRQAATKAGQSLEQKATQGLSKVPGVGRRGDGDAAPPTPPVR